MELWLSCTIARQSAEKHLHKTGADQVIFDKRHTRRTSVAQSLFSWVLAHDRGPDASGSSKNPSGPVGIFPQKGVPQVPGDKPNPSKEG